MNEREAKGLQTDPAINLRALAPDEPFRFVFLPDIHLRDRYHADEGMAACLAAAGSLEPQPAFLLTGGDQCDGLRDLEMPEATARAERFVRIWKAQTQIPAYHCLGNHDSAAWDVADAAQEHPQFGMQLMMDKLGMERLSYSFDCGRWHFVVLDNIECEGPGHYIGKVGEEELAWLREDLERNQEKPTVVACHLPPVSAVEFLTDRPEKTEAEWRLSFKRMSSNPAELVEVLQAGNVRAVISGHLHLVERIEMLGQTFTCCGSASGHKWTGPRLDTLPGLAIFDCYPDGEFTFTYHDYGWETQG